MTEGAERQFAFRWLSAERTAVVLGLWQFLDHFLGAELYRRLWILALIPTLFLVIVTAVLIAHYATKALHAPALTAAERYRTGLVILLVSLVVQFVSLPPIAIPQTVAARIYFASHQTEWAEEGRRAGADQPYSLTYLHGVPDGGLAFIHVPEGRPEDLPIAQQLRLTGERINGCYSIADAWLCGYD